MDRLFIHVKLDQDNTPGGLEGCVKNSFAAFNMEPGGSLAVAYNFGTGCSQNTYYGAINCVGGIVDAGSSNLGLYDSIVRVSRLQLNQQTNVTISSGSFSAPQIVRVNVETQGGAASDDLDSITNIGNGTMLILKQQTAGHTVVVKHGTGNIFLRAGVDFSLDSPNKRLFLICDGVSAWCEL